MGTKALIGVMVAATGLFVAACGSSGSPGSAGGGTTTTAAPAGAGVTAVLKTESSKLGTVLADGSGLTVYWFAADHGNMSACSGACASAWPPVIGTPQAAAGAALSGTLGTITRSDSQKQATFDGHPLYTFKADSAPGQVNGNNVDGFGAKWYAITIGPGGSASIAPTTGGGGGYGGYGGGY